MKKSSALSLGFSLLCAAGALFAQGRGGGIWTTANYDAQRTSWVRSDSRLTPESLQKSFQLLWKFKVPNNALQLNSLTQGVMLDGLHSYTGMRTLLAMGASSSGAYTIDADLGVWSGSTTSARQWPPRERWRARAA